MTDNYHMRYARNLVLRLFVVVLIMLDTLRRILFGTDYRRIDESLFWIEAAVLCLILLEVFLGLRDRIRVWSEERRIRKLLNSELDSLTESAANALMDTALTDKRPGNDLGTMLYGRIEIGIVERDHTGWRFTDGIKPFLRAWAKKRRRQRRRQK